MASIILLLFIGTIISLMQLNECQGWTIDQTCSLSTRRSVSRNHFDLMGKQKHNDENKNDIQNPALKEPEDENVRFGKMTYWDDSYKNSLGDNDSETENFSWYCGWHEELGPFFTELVPVEENPRVLVPGIGNDGCIRDMFDSGFHRITAFDYAPEGVECARRMFGPERLQHMDDLRVADARSLPYENDGFDAVLEKGTLDSIYLSGGKDKELARKHLGMAVSELVRVVKKGGIIFSVTAACAEAVQEAFDVYNENDCCLEQLRDGSLYITEDGYTSNNVDATMLVWKII